MLTSTKICVYDIPLLHLGQFRIRARAVSVVESVVNHKSRRMEHKRTHRFFNRVACIELLVILNFYSSGGSREGKVADERTSQCGLPDGCSRNTRTSTALGKMILSGTGSQEETVSYAITGSMQEVIQMKAETERTERD